MMTPVTLVEPVYRPPSEAGSLLIQVTIGCSYNACTFCGMYRSKRFQIRPLADITSDLKRAASFFEKRGETPRKIFLCDGDALAAPADLLLSTAQNIAVLLPRTSRIGIYASARNVLGKTTEELEALARAKINIAYLGVESGDDEVLTLLNKEVNAEASGAAAQKLKDCGWKVSQIFMLGAGGSALSSQHCRESARLISATAPHFLSFLTTVPVPGTPYGRAVERGDIKPLSVRELLHEMQSILEGIRAEGSKIIFRANHVSNQFPLEGILPRDTGKLTATLRDWIEQCPAGLYPRKDPTSL